MVKFYLMDNNEYAICDDNTIKKFELEVAKEVSEEEMAKHGYAYHTKDGELILGPSAESILYDEYSTLLHELREMDYMSSKYVDGDYTEEEWEEIKAIRKAKRDRIREIETQLNLKNN